MWIDDIFSYDGWDPLDADAVVLYNVELKVPFAGFEKGTTFNSMVWNFGEGYLNLFEDEGYRYKKVRLSIQQVGEVTSHVVEHDEEDSDEG